MYEILSGTVGVFKDYGTEGEKHVADLSTGDFLGEMEMVELRPRSATCVVLTDTAELRRYSEDNWLELFETSPVKVYLIMKQLTERLRRTTQDYTEACGTIQAVLDTARRHEKPAPELLEAMQRFSGVYSELSR